MNPPPNSANRGSPHDAPQNEQVGDTAIDAVHAALQADLGLGEDPDKNQQLLQQAADFVAQVNAQRIDRSTTAHFAALRQRVAAWAEWFARPLGQRSAWLPVGTGLVATLAVTVGLVLWAGQERGDSSDSETLRGTLTAQTWRPAEPRVAVARLVGELRGAGCSATVEERVGAGEGVLTVALDLSVPPCNANQLGDALLARYGLAVDLRGRATIVVPLGR